MRVVQIRATSSTPDQISYLNYDDSTATDSVAIKTTLVLVIRSSGIIMKEHCITLPLKLLVSLYNLFHDENITLHERSNPNFTSLINYLIIDSFHKFKRKKNKNATLLGLHFTYKKLELESFQKLFQAVINVVDFSQVYYKEEK